MRRGLPAGCLAAAAAAAGCLAGLGGAAGAAGGYPLSVASPTPGGGIVVSSPPGIECREFACSAEFAPGTVVSLSAEPNRGFAFSGFTTDCTGPRCTLTIDGPRAVRADFVRFAELPYAKPSFRPWTGTAVLRVRVGGPGRIVLHGRRVESQVRTPTTDENVKLPVLPKPSLARKLRNRGEGKTWIRVAFTPAAGTTARLQRIIRLKFHR